jgi:hypothetical protein
MICFLTENTAVNKAIRIRLLGVSKFLNLSATKHSYLIKTFLADIINKKLTKNYENIVFNFRVSQC